MAIEDADFEIACAELVSQVDENLKQNFSAIFGSFLQEIKHPNIDVTLNALKKFSKLAELIRVNPTLLPLLISCLNQDTKFEDWFIN